ncbi:uncharacterized protein LOC107365622 [Tetranychus urticae]|nr:uncharacterized protein LOC107365622 [Tetranychus urticae]
MDQQNNNSDKIKFKVKFFGQYHDIVIDRNDDKYIYKTQQLFQQLALITGIPSKYTSYVKLFGAEPDEEDWRTYHLIRNDAPLISDGQPHWPIEGGLRAFDNAVPRYHLSFEAGFCNVITRNILISYGLIPESEVPEGVCSRFFCQYKYTKSFFDKIKMAIYNEELNSKIRLLDFRTLGLWPWFDEHLKVYKEFNVEQYIGCHAPCFHQFDRARRVYGIERLACYNRNRG